MSDLTQWLMGAIARNIWSQPSLRVFSLIVVLSGSPAIAIESPLFGEFDTGRSPNRSEPAPLFFEGDKVPVGRSATPTTAQPQAQPKPQPTRVKTLGERVAAAAIAHEGADVTMGPGRGFLACAWAVNRFGLKPVLGRKVGSNPNLVVSVQRDLIKQGLVTEIPKSAAQPGDIVIAAGPGRKQHIGIVVSKRSGQGVEALSTRGGRFRWRSDLNFGMKYKVPGQIYRLKSPQQTLSKANPKPKIATPPPSTPLFTEQPFGTNPSWLTFIPGDRPTVAPVTSSASPQPTHTPKSADIIQWFSNRRSLGSVAVGHAEGNLTATGRIRSIYYGHNDPGNGVKNIGFCSLQKYLWKDLNGDGTVSFAEADQRCSQLLKGQAPKTAAKMLDFGFSADRHREATLNGLDLWNQSRVAGRQFPRRYHQARQRGLTGEAAILWARVESFRVLRGAKKGRLSASGLFRICRRSPKARHLSPWNCIARDQRRRVRAIARALQTHPSQNHLSNGDTTHDIEKLLLAWGNNQKSPSPS